MPYSKEKHKEYSKLWHRNLSPDKKLAYKIKRKEWRLNNKRNSSYYNNHTLLGFIGRTYTYMNRRVLGKSKNPELYINKEILSYSEFKEWALQCKELIILRDIWISNNRDLKLRPTINRKDTNKGYTLDNMEWMEYGKNAGLARKGLFTGNQYTNA